MFISKFNRAFAVTSLGVIAAIIGMYCAIDQNLNYAILCLAIAGICDMFDGKIARKYNKTDEDSKYGIQIDSLADIFAFGVFPVVILITMGLTQWYYFIIYALFIINGISRLAYFNIMAEKSGPVKVFTGLPITSSSMSFPFFWLIITLLELDTDLLNIIFPILMLIMAVSFILNVKVIKKPGKVENIIFTLAAIAFAIWILFFK